MERKCRSVMWHSFGEWPKVIVTFVFSLFYINCRIYSPKFKMNVYLKIAQLYLEHQDHVSAEAHLNRAGLLQAEMDNKELQILYKVGSLTYGQQASYQFGAWQHSIMV